MANTEKLIRAKAEKMLQAADEMKEAKIPEEAKGELIAEMLPSGLYHIRYEGAGRVPDKLQGQYTSIAKVKQLIEQYKKGL